MTVPSPVSHWYVAPSPPPGSENVPLPVSVISSPGHTKIKPSSFGAGKAESS